MQVSRDRALLIGLTAVLGSVITVMRRHVMMSMDPWRYEVVAGMVHLFLVPVYMSIIMSSKDVVPATQGWMPGALWVAGITLLNAACTVAFLFSLRGDADVGVVSTLAGLSPIVTVMFGALFLGDVPSFRQAVGVGLVLVGSVIAAGR